MSPVTIESSEKSEKGQELVAKKTLNKGNTATKLLIDQTLGALVNVALFLGGMAYLKGADSATIVEIIKRVGLKMADLGI